MFSIFKSSPTKKLHKTYSIKLEEAMIAQRNGDIHTYSMLTEEADKIWKAIQELEKNDK
ncbi:DUF6435 family protein [Neptunomonas sp.]|uniref:DUF6435 family protein n=1 Tax=Neptunomonas sp. TaxID=1971898 RepID=UPI00356A63B6